MAPLRILVTGPGGQLALALRAASTAGLAVETIGRPELDLARPADWSGLFSARRPDIVVNAAAYTAVDEAEREPDLAMAVNAAGAGAVAEAAMRVGAPVIQLSTDYVFDGAKGAPYAEDDAPAPAGAYGLSKLEGERAVARATADHAILRTSWVFSSGGRNFVRTMLSLARARPELRVVADQIGRPTYAPDLAAAVIQVARNLRSAPGRADLRGVFHLAGSGETSWAGFAEAIFAASARHGGPSASVAPIPSALYPTAARRPANSRLDCARIALLHGIVLPAWTDALDRCMSELQARGELAA